MTRQRCTAPTTRDTQCRRTGGWQPDGTTSDLCYQHALTLAGQLNLTLIVGLLRGRVVDITTLPAQSRHRGRYTRHGATA